MRSQVRWCGCEARGHDRLDGLDPAEAVHPATPPGGGAYINFKAVAEWCAASARPVHDVPKLLAEQVRKELSEAGS
jgi:hypothetical protein